MSIFEFREWLENAIPAWALLIPIGFALIVLFVLRSKPPIYKDGE